MVVSWGTGVLSVVLNGGMGRGIGVRSVHSWGSMGVGRGSNDGLQSRGGVHSGSSVRVDSWGMGGVHGRGGVRVDSWSGVRGVHSWGSNGLNDSWGGIDGGGSMGNDSWGNGLDDGWGSVDLVKDFVVTVIVQKSRKFLQNLPRGRTW